MVILLGGSAPALHAAGQVHHENPGIQQAEATLQSLKETYEQEQSSFFDLVSSSAYFDTAQFRMDVRQTWDQFSGWDLRFWVDQSLQRQGHVVLQTHWIKRAVDRDTGKIQITEGKADLIFEYTDPARLLDIQGQSPF